MISSAAKAPFWGCIALLCACSDYSVSSKEPIDPLINDKDPCIEVHPKNLNFDAINVGIDPTQTEVVTVENACEGDLELYSLKLKNESSPFEIGTVGSILVPGLSSTDFTVTFDPNTANDWSTKIVIESNDPETPEAKVNVNGSGIAPIISVNPESYYFGEPYIGCQQEEMYIITNEGNALLEVTDISTLTSSTEFGLDLDPVANGPLPFLIEPGDSAQIYLQYMPIDQYSDNTYITAVSNDPFNGEVSVDAGGTGSKYGDNKDTFEQPVRVSTDILFTLDRSCSMIDNNEAVTANFNVFFETIVGFDADYHIAVVVEDDGCILGSKNYIDNTMTLAEAQETFETMADIDATSVGTYTEAGFSLAQNALSPSKTGPTGCNNGFFRDTAYLSLVHVSDEEEQSSASWSSFVTDFQEMKEGADDVVINAVAGDVPDGCEIAGTDVHADPGYGYFEAAAATDGSFLSICASDWASKLEELAVASVGMHDTFELTQRPVPQTISVDVDGHLTPGGWSYDDALQSVVFETEQIPAGGSSIEIKYELAPDCDF